jgi:hypothetical protein
MRYQIVLHQQYTSAKAELSITDARNAQTTARQSSLRAHRTASHSASTVASPDFFDQLSTPQSLRHAYQGGCQLVIVRRLLWF